MVMKDVYKKAIDSLLKGKMTKEDLLEVLQEQYQGYQDEIKRKEGVIGGKTERLNYLEKQLAEVYEKYKKEFD